MRTRSTTAILAAALLIGSCGTDDGTDRAAQEVTTTGGTQPATTASTTTVPPPDAQRAVPVVVDTDMASDDLIALAYLAASPDVELLAVTVTGTGEATCPVGADNARRVLAALGHEQVPVACGPSEPLAGDRAFPSEWRDAADGLYGLDLATPAASGTSTDETTDAVTLLVEAVTGASEPVTVLTLGPLTDLALAFAAQPAMVAEVDRVVIMGGALEVDGNVVDETTGITSPAEWNLYVDPEATDQVIRSGAPITLVPLDATNLVPVDRDLADRMVANDLTDASHLVAQLLDRSAPPYLWDPLAAIATARPDLVPTQPVEVAVTTDGDEAGRTVADPAGTPIEVADPPAATIVIDHLLRTLAGLGPDDPLAEPEIVPPVGEATVGFDGTTCSVTAPATVPVGDLVVTLEDTGTPYVAIVAHVVEGATVEETLEYSLSHPGGAPPMVDAFEIVGPDFLASPARIELLPGDTVIVCSIPDGTIIPGSSLVVTG